MSKEQTKKKNKQTNPELVELLLATVEFTLKSLKQRLRLASAFWVELLRRPERTSLPCWAFGQGPSPRWASGAPSVKLTCWKGCGGG